MIIETHLTPETLALIKTDIIFHAKVATQLDVHTSTVVEWIRKDDIKLCLPDVLIIIREHYGYGPALELTFLSEKNKALPQI